MLGRLTGRGSGTEHDGGCSRHGCSGDHPKHHVNDHHNRRPLINHNNNDNHDNDNDNHNNFDNHHDIRTDVWW